MLAGAPAVLNTRIGGFAMSLPLSVLFLSIGAGAVFQVAWTIGKLIQASESRHSTPLLSAGGVALGMVVLYVTGLLIK